VAGVVILIVVEFAPPLVVSVPPIDSNIAELVVQSAAGSRFKVVTSVWMEPNVKLERSAAVEVGAIGVEMVRDAPLPTVNGLAWVVPVVNASEPAFIFVAPV
jgi:hypothetical protein